MTWLSHSLVLWSSVLGGAISEEFSNSFALDLGPKNYRAEALGNGNQFYQSGTYTTSMHATWMLRMWDPGYESPGFLAGLGLAYGYYNDRELTYQVFEWRAEFGPAFEPVSWLRIGILGFGGFGFHDLDLPPSAFAQTGIGGAGLWGFSFGANAQVTWKIFNRLHLSGQAGFRGLYASYALIGNNQIDRAVTISSNGLLAGASIDFTF